MSFKIFFQLFFEADPMTFNQYQISLRRGNHNPKPLSTCSVVAPPGPGKQKILNYFKNKEEGGVGPPPSFLFLFFSNTNFTEEIVVILRNADRQS